MEINKIIVAGAGAMGRGIAHVFAQFGIEVELYDISVNAINNALSTISHNIDRQIKKNIFPIDQKLKILDKISSTTNLKHLSQNANIVIEAISENKKTKSNLLKDFDPIMHENTIFATNTSSISITELAANLSKTRQERFIGMHFMNPVPIMNLVEIINGYSTNQEITEIIRELVLRINKVPVIVNDYPGFISNRILMPMINEAIFALYEGVSDRESIDNVMKLGMNHPMGPLALADFIGLDVCLNIMDVLYEGFKDSKYRACPLLRQMVISGNHGKKTGKGFYSY